MIRCNFQLSGIIFYLNINYLDIMSMLEYAKMVLSKVAFDKGLFVKEFRKFMKLLSSEEARELTYWQSMNYAHIGV